MFVRISRIAAASLAAALLAACGGGGTTQVSPPQQQPQTWKVQAGVSSQSEAYQGLQFYPSAITIDAGDTVTWSFPAGEPHTVTLLGPRSSPPPPNDPSVPAPAGGSTYDGSTYTSSGFLLLGKTYSLTFTKAGVYKVYCLIHGGMEQTITVQYAGTPYPATQSTIDSQATAAEQSDLQVAANTPAQFPYTAGGPHIAEGMSFGLNTANPPPTSSVMRFLDGGSVTNTTTTVPVGTTVTWTNLSSNMPHTVTFGVAGQAFPTMNPFSPPSGPTSYDGTQVVNSGPMMPGQSFSLTFTKAGTYTYHCLFHDDTENMIGTIVVQ
ncbi:MAG TPA: plastocyanin/azurin family copper-binding protein [Candidatus Baltobacteraceae bacterium]